MKKIKSPDQADRCQYIIPTAGQCIQVALEGQNVCANHGGYIARSTQERSDLKNYNINKYKARLITLANSSHIKNLREEIGILRILIEEHLLIAEKSPVNFMAQAPKIGDLVMKVEKLVSSCDRIDEKLKTSMDKTQILQLCQEIIDIIGRHISDGETLGAIAHDIMEIDLLSS